MNKVIEMFLLIIYVGTILATSITLLQQHQPILAGIMFGLFGVDVVLFHFYFEENR